jgi:FkbM family methyltransferase
MKYAPSLLKIMQKLLGKLRYHFQTLLFEKFAIPRIQNEKISKILLKKYLPSNPVIIDCGAHDGSDSVALAKLFKKATIYAFEPVKDLYTSLKVNTSHFKNIITYPIALADLDGEMDFYISAGGSDASSSLLEPRDHLTDHPDTFFANKVTVATSTLDSWAKENNINKIDMLWLDMQGFELKMLMASPYILETVSVIHTEVSTRETYKEVAQYHTYRSFLEKKGFTMQIEAIPAGWDMGNVLFIRNNHIQL